MTGICFDPAANIWDVFLDLPTGRVLHSTAATPSGAIQLLEQAMARGAHQGTQRDDSHMAMRVRAMRKFFGAAATVGLDTRADVAMRAAIGEFFDCHLASRTELSAAQWVTARIAVLEGILAW